MKMIKIARNFLLIGITLDTLECKVNCKKTTWMDMTNNARVHGNGNLDIILNYYTVDVALSFRKFVLLLN